MLQANSLGGDFLKKHKIMQIGIALFGLSYVLMTGHFYSNGATDDSTENQGSLTTEIESSEETLTEADHLSKNYVGFTSINNYFKNIDYKINDERRKELINSLALASDIQVENVNEEDISQNLNNLNTEESWLINNNILSRDYEFSTSNIKITDENSYDYMSQSEFWMLLYKSIHGSKESRPVVFKDTSVRDGEELQTKNSYDISEDGKKIDAIFDGDYWVFITPNVYELYFKELLDKGIIDKESFNDKNGKKFLADYEKLSSEKVAVANVPWASELGLSFCQAKSLGYSYKVEKDFHVTPKVPNYFKSEKIYTIDALHDVETLLRTTEKDMSKLEASIVSYKYGITYLSNLTEEDKNTVQYLIAKGILNYEDANELVNLYGVLDRETAYKILYRVANKDARLDFSTVTLTDNETSWQAKGYGEDHISIIRASAVPYVETVSKKELKHLLNSGNTINEGDSDDDPDSTESNEFIDDLLTLFGNPKEVSAVSKSYTVIKVFDSIYNYTYENNLI